MNIRSLVGCAMLCVSTVSATNVPFFIKLDGRWYNTLPTSPFIWFDTTGVRVPAAVMINCQRADGLPQTFSPYSFYYGPYYYPIYQLQETIYHPGGPDTGYNYVLELNTGPGNIVCIGEIPEPPPSDPPPQPEPPLFINSFE